MVVGEVSRGACIGDLRHGVVSPRGLTWPFRQQPGLGCDGGLGCAATPGVVPHVKMPAKADRCLT